jgi:polyisoprenoid-binding protein YceI
MTTTTTDFRALTGSYTIDPAHSRSGFVARHTIGPRVRGAFNVFQDTLRAPWLLAGCTLGYAAYRM